MNTSLTIALDLTGFTSACQHLAKVSGTDYNSVLRYQVASVVKVAAMRTKVRPEAKAEKDARTAASKTAIDEDKYRLNTGIRKPATRGTMWRYYGNGRLKRMTGPDFSPIPRHFKNAEWNEGQNQAASYQWNESRNLRAFKGATGLSRQSWIQISDALGVAVEDVPPSSGNAAIKKGRRAIATNGKRYTNGTAAAMIEGTRLTIVGRNMYPLGSRLQFESILAGAFKTRASAFQNEFKNGVFDDMEKRAARYPGLFKKPA